MIKVLSLVMTLGAAAAWADEPLKVVTTIETFADFARRVGGEVSVEALSHGYQDPQALAAEPDEQPRRPADPRRLDLEIGWLPLLTQGARNEKESSRARPRLSTRVDAHRGAQVKAMGDIHPGGNPHSSIPQTPCASPGASPSGSSSCGPPTPRTSTPSSRSSSPR